MTDNEPGFIQGEGPSRHPEFSARAKIVLAEI